jgi:hypothetical protein
MHTSQRTSKVLSLAVAALLVGALLYSDSAPLPYIR